MILLTAPLMSDDGEKIVVNEALIESIHPHKQSGGCTLKMASGAIIAAKEDMRAVMDRIWLATGLAPARAETDG